MRGNQRVTSADPEGSYESLEKYGRDLAAYINPRGSSTYGADFVSRVFEDWGGEDYEDQMAAVDRILRRGYVDADRLGIHGYSYGGFMTS
mgnify:CR=1 FL=1